MPDREKRKRDAPISYRPPKGQGDEFARRVAASGMSANAYITKSNYNIDPSRQSRRPHVEAAEVARLVGACARLNDTLRTLSATSPDPQSQAILAEMQRQLTEIRTACFEALGRGPRHREPEP